LGKKYLNSLSTVPVITLLFFVVVVEFEIRDPGWEKIMIRDNHPGSATLAASNYFLCLSLGKHSIIGKESSTSPSIPFFHSLTFKYQLTVMPGFSLPVLVAHRIWIQEQLNTNTDQQLLSAL